jgi:serine/threonine protein kinase
MSNVALGTLGPYRLLSLLGAGGMAEVYRAHDPRLDREVAIKVLPVDLARQPGFLERFRREARNVAQLDHPNIMPIYDFGEQGGAPYVVMPLIEGGTLRERIIKQEVCSLRDAVTIIYQVALALEEAHNHGLVHRDVKPANILLASGDRAVLADFGIACVLAEEHNEPLTRAGMGIGTAEYMSPEQARGEPIDHRADVYALGIVLFQALTGQVPFTSEDHFTTAMMQVYEEPPAPRSLNQTIPPAVEALILKALAKEPGRRFQSAAAFARALTEAVPWLTMPSTPVRLSGPQRAVRRDGKGTATPRRAASGPQQSTGRTSRPKVDSWSGWPSAADSQSRTLLALPGHQQQTGPLDFADHSQTNYGFAPARPFRRKRWAVLAGVMLALLVAAGVFAAGGQLPLQTNMAYSSQPKNQPTARPVQPTATLPPPTATPQSVYYMANLFELAQGDLQQGDRLGDKTSISNDQYAAFEGPDGSIYRSGAATQYGRAFGTGTVVSDKHNQFLFVILVDRFDTPTQAQQYYQYEVSLLSQPTNVSAGQQASAGLARVMGDQAVYRLALLDSNIVVTFASNETATPLTFQPLFAQLAQTIDQRGHRCQYTAQLTPVPGSADMCNNA